MFNITLNFWERKNYLVIVYFMDFIKKIQNISGVTFSNHYMTLTAHFNFCFVMDEPCIYFYCHVSFKHCIYQYSLIFL